jgi:hypothetical protein
MNLFSAKTIGLYGLAIASAIGFFNVVTNYGEANIAAPIDIAGNYAIDTANLPDCLHNKSILLKLQQSGIFLNASLVENRQDLALTRETPTLSGRFHDRQVELTGKLPSQICPQAQLRIVGSIVKSSANTNLPPQLQGRLWLTTGDGNSKSIELPVTNFTAIARSAQRPKTLSH